MKVIFTCKFCNKEKTKHISKTQVQPAYCSIECKSEYQKLAKPVTKEWLEQKYITEELSANEIAELVNRDAKSVWNWLKDFKIPTRPRGHNHKENKKFAFWLDPTSGYTPATGVKRSPEYIAALAKRNSGSKDYLKGKVHHMFGKRGAEVRTWKGGVTPERQKFYDTDEWKEAVKTVWKRDNATCQRCNKKFKYKETKFNIHHIVSFANKELRAEPTNLVLLCNDCHKWVHSNQNINKEFINV